MAFSGSALGSCKNCTERYLGGVGTIRIINDPTKYSECTNRAFLVGFAPTYKMTKDNWDGFFNPEIKVEWTADWGKLGCTRSKRTTLRPGDCEYVGTAVEVQYEENNTLICAYAAGDCLTSARVLNKKAGRLFCLEVPDPPPPPPFCPSISSAQPPKAVYARDGNTFFSPKIKTFIANKLNQVLDADISSTQNKTSNQEDFESKKQYDLVPSGNTRRLKFIVKLDMEEVCLNQEKDGASWLIGCYPRPKMPEPQISHGGFDAARNLHKLKVEIAGSPQSLLLYPGTETKFYGYMLGAFRANLDSNGGIDSSSKKKRCDGKTIVNETSSCDQGISIVTAKKCPSGAIIESSENCTRSDSSAITINAKKCSGGRLVEQSKECNPGMIIYQDNPSGSKLCLRGWDPEPGRYKIERNIGGTTKTIYFKELAKKLVPVKFKDGKAVEDDTKSAKYFADFTQQELDDASFGGDNIFSAKGQVYQYRRAPINRKDAYGKIIESTHFIIEKIDSDTSDRGNPLFLSAAEIEAKKRLDPAELGLCITP
ncbi:hypothetical protein RLOatenuis_3280 [Rickettsiales bacterium]|nr:hypothetical protein RLOatenuis_3280 [Rickettsiales bacterium]